MINGVPVNSDNLEPIVADIEMSFLMYIQCKLYIVYGNLIKI